MAAVETPTGVPASKEGVEAFRNLQAEISNYDISWKRHTVTMPVKERPNVEGETNE